MPPGKIAISAMLSCCLAAVAATAFAEVRINVVCPRPGVLDEAGKESGWVELVNNGEESAQLNGDYGPDSGFRAAHQVVLGTEAKHGAAEIDIM